MLIFFIIFQSCSHCLYIQDQSADLQRILNIGGFSKDIQRHAIDAMNITFTKIGEYNDKGRLTGWVIYDNIAYGRSYNNLFILNITEITNVTIIKEWELNGGGFCFDIFEDLLVFCNKSNFIIFNISQISNPIQISNLFYQGRPNEVIISDNLAYIADYDLGMMILNITDLAHPAKIGEYVDSNCQMKSITVSNNIAYIMDEYYKFLCLNISNPQNPTIISNYRAFGNPYNLVLVDDLAYISDSFRLLVILNISDPSKPKEIGSYFAYFERMCLSTYLCKYSDYIFIYNKWGTISIIDISDPKHLTEIIKVYDSRLEYIQETSEIARYKDFFFVSVSNGFQIYHFGIDSDGDTLSDFAESALIHSDPFNHDTDFDGMPDGWEYHHKLSPIVDDADGDCDNDGLSNILEYFYHTNPQCSDSDGDLVNDGVEIEFSSNPLNEDTDGDRLSDYYEIYDYHTNASNSDSDGDTISDYIEIRKYHTNPCSTDTDDDGYSDWEEIYIHNTDPLVDEKSKNIQKAFIIGVLSIPICISVSIFVIHRRKSR